jgi:hypothetical protein
MEKEKLKSPTSSPNLSGSSTNYKKPAGKSLPIDIDQLQYQDFFERTQPGSSTTSHKPNMHSYTKNFDKCNFYSLSSINFSGFEKADSDNGPVVSDHFYTSSGKIVPPPREW